MNKCIILSVQPQWLHKILTGKKTIEIRKSTPKCDYPIDVYLYCTKGDINLFKVFREVYMYFDMSVAEPFEDFKYYKLDGYDYSGKGKARFQIENGFYDELYHKLNGKIVAKFTLNKVDYTTTVVKYGKNYTHERFEKDIKNYVRLEKILEQTCLTEEELINYELTNHTFGVFAWHIDNLQIFDKPMELKEFYKNETLSLDDFIYKNYSGYNKYSDYLLGRRLTRPFQSWGYAYKE